MMLQAVAHRKQLDVRKFDVALIPAIEPVFAADIIYHCIFARFTGGGARNEVSPILSEGSQGSSHSFTEGTLGLV